MNSALIPDEIQYILTTVAVGLSSIAVVPYVRGILKKTIDPRPLTWLGWSLLLGTTLISQVLEKGFELNQSALFISVLGCFIIFLFSIRNGNIKILDWICLGLGFICIGIYTQTEDAWTTTLFALGADVLIGIPTIHNVIVNPKAERSVIWKLGAIAQALVLITCIGYNPIYAVFPTYLFFYNGSVVLLSLRKDT